MHCPTLKALFLFCAVTLSCSACCFMGIPFGPTEVCEEKPDPPESLPGAEPGDTYDSYRAEDCGVIISYADQDQDGFGDPNYPLSACDDFAGPTADNNLDCGDHNSTVNPYERELCNEFDTFDNNCDGVTDRVYEKLSCGTGVCFDQGPTCVSGEPAGCQPLKGAQLESCDGYDNDCDGAVDECCDTIGDLIVEEGEEVLLSGSHTRYHNVQIAGVLRVPAFDGTLGGRLELHACGEIHIAPGGSIVADGAGYAGGQGAGAGEMAAGGANGGNGGAADYFSAASSQAYANYISTDVQMGSGGGANDIPGLRGGGAIVLSANAIRVEGIISAAGESSSAYLGESPGGGSGGSVLLVALERVSLAGQVLAPGSSLPWADDGGGGGGGGVVKIFSAAIDHQGVVDVSGGAGGSGFSGGSGGQGGVVSVVTEQLISQGFVSLKGGAGGAAEFADYAGRGGRGGNLYLFARALLSLSPIEFSGGAAGASENGATGAGENGALHWF